jgi:hypothetical protein
MEAQFKLELDCHRQFGDEDFNFYEPHIIGDFVLVCWSSQKAGVSTKTSVSNRSFSYNTPTYAIQIYESGNLVDPTSGS